MAEHNQIIDWHIPRASLGQCGSSTRYPRGSTSSQGSVHSNHSSKSTYSGSHLLTAANLISLTRTPEVTPTHHYKTNMSAQALSEFQAYQDKHSAHSDSRINGTTINTDRDLDTVSVASSTHFTVVNGVGGPHKRIKKPACGGHKLTALVMTMSFIFLAGILGAIIYVETRSREFLY